MKFDLSSSRHSQVSQSEWILLDCQQRINLHPLFESLDDIDCRVSYNIKLKCFYVEYAKNQSTGKYEKSILTNIVNNIVNDVLELHHSPII